MNGLLEIEFCGTTTMRARLENALLEEFHDGDSLHADSGIALIIRKDDCISCTHSENRDEYILNNGTRYTITWDYTCIN